MNNNKKTTLITFLLGLVFCFTHCDLAVQSTPSDIELVSMGEAGGNTNNDESGSHSNESSTKNGEEFYKTKVLKEINKSCILCHTSIVNNPIIQAPLSIISYTQSLALLKSGSSKNNNKFYNKASNKVSHTGGNQCASGSATVCDLVMQWWMIETGQTSSAKDVSGEITSISSSGKVYGWAGVPNSNEIVDVEFSIAGQFIGDTTANKAGYNGGLSGNRAFEFNIPQAFKDGKIYSLVANLIYENNEIKLQNSPQNFSIYEASPDAIIYFNQTLAPLLNQKCSRCHVISQDQFFNSLITPKPNANGTSTNNEFVRMPLGNYNGKSHPGGNICGTIGSSPCKEIVEWWNLEFNK